MFTWSDIFTTGYQTQAEAEANAALQKAKLEAQGSLNEIDVYALRTPLESKDAAAYAGFKEGLSEGLDNIKASVTGFGPFKWIPVWVWIVGGVAVFWWIGGVAWSKGKLK